MTGPARPQHVNRGARDHGGQPAREVGDRLRVRAAQAQPGFLNRVVGVADRAEHAVGDRAQTRAMALELLGQKVALAHSLTAFSRWGSSALSWGCRNDSLGCDRGRSACAVTSPFSIST